MLLGSTLEILFIFFEEEKRLFVLILLSLHVVFLSIDNIRRKMNFYHFEPPYKFYSFSCISKINVSLFCFCGLFFDLDSCLTTLSIDMSLSDSIERSIVGKFLVLLWCIACRSLFWKELSF